MITRQILHCITAGLGAAVLAWGQMPEPVTRQGLQQPQKSQQPQQPQPPADLDLHLDDLAVQLDSLAPALDLQLDNLTTQLDSFGPAMAKVSQKVEAAMAKAWDKSDEARFKVATRIDPNATLALAQEGAARLQEAQERMREAQERAREAAERAESRGGRRVTDEERLYSEGQRALDSQHWDRALDCFTEVAARGGSRADGALYWKAYTLNKLGRRDQAAATLGDLRKTYAASRWLDDARALEVEVKQASGGSVAPESVSDDEIKLLALNGLMQSDPERAFPILEKLLKSAQSPHLKDRALFVLAQSSTPRSRQLLDQIARGGGNPDLQVKAVQYLGVTNRRGGGNQVGNNDQMLLEIYTASDDAAVKRAVLTALGAARDKDRLLQIAKSEKSADLRSDAISQLDASGVQAELWQLYQAETSPNVKRQILNSIAGGGNTERLIEVARSEKDAGLRRAAIQDLSSVKAANASNALVAIYGNEPDAQVKRSIVYALSSQRNAKALVDLGRKEKDAELKREIVRSLVNMKSPDATAFLEEILK